MGRKRAAQTEIIANEFVRPATAEEAAAINFLAHRRGALRGDLSRLLEADPTLARTKEILETQPDSTVLIIDTVLDRGARIRTDLALFGIVVETREAVHRYGQITEPYTLAVRIRRPESPPEKSVPKPVIPHKVTWKKE